MRFDKQPRHSLHAAQQVMAEQTERRGGRIKSAAWRGSAAVLTEILTVDANMDPPNHTAYLCMWWVMTWTSIGLGWGEKKRRISYNSVVAGWLNAVAECSQVHLLCTALLLVQHWSTLYFGFSAILYFHYNLEANIVLTLHLFEAAVCNFSESSTRLCGSNSAPPSLLAAAW